VANGGLNETLALAIAQESPTLSRMGDGGLAAFCATVCKEAAVLEIPYFIPTFSEASHGV